MSDYLSHHGILGQRWGIRRFQNEDGSLTSAGKKRYNVDIEKARNDLKSAKLKLKKSKSASASQKAKIKVDLAKERLTNEKIKDRLNNEKKKSKHRLKLEEQYRQKGLNEEEAEIAAYKRAKTEKIIGVTAGLTLAAVTAYVVHKRYDKNVDKFLKEGTELSRITSDGDQSVHDAFYASFKNGDNSTYKGFYGKHLSDQGKTVYQKKIRVNNGIKIASDKSALRALRELSDNDQSFQDSLKSDFSEALKFREFMTPKQSRVFDKGMASLKRGKVDQNVLNAVNINLVSRTDSTQKFYDQLKKSGYGAIGDLNDKKLSGYMTKMPLVVFNSDVTVTSVRNVGKNEIEKAYNNTTMKNKLKSMAPKVAVGLAAVKSIQGLSKMNKTKNYNQVVENYRKEHPDSKLTYDEIINNYYKEK